DYYCYSGDGNIGLF
nr:immunoglobulin light chain junction region [Macaca mulatta]MOW27855.1 immunoglobulin light chain junction region [Macaca mulatta]MOW27989.1 immunoglobulin light chain junction region [Macaca mulatta]MOW28330.1 immunoglobulin light chain junction region [Macaca mulatta]MOW28508.1 immunoglobulin light chain junction region [Macaca mulatta]